jgi:hypothetical protein
LQLHLARIRYYRRSSVAGRYGPAFLLINLTGGLDVYRALAVAVMGIRLLTEGNLLSGAEGAEAISRDRGTVEVQIGALLGTIPGDEAEASLSQAGDDPSSHGGHIGCAPRSVVAFVQFVPFEKEVEAFVAQNLHDSSCHECHSS